MKQLVIVGAGISGLTAAIILAREGYDVTVLEQKKIIGGASLVASDVSGREVCVADMTPLDIDAMSRYLGFSLAVGDGSDPVPFYNPLPFLRLRAFGNLIELPMPSNVQMKMVERGQRPSSIVATGMFREAFEALYIPYTKAYGHFAAGPIR